MASLRAIDADGHVQEPAEAWERHLPAKYRELAPRQLLDESGRIRQLVGGELAPYIPVPSAGGWSIPAGGHDPKQRLADMDRQGVEASLLFPTFGLMFAGLARTDVQVALCRAYNDWLASFCEADPRRLVGVALLPQHDLAESLAETSRAVCELGFRGVMLRPNPVRGRSLHHPYWEPLYRRLEELDVPLAVHEGTTQDLPQSGRDRFDNFALRHVCSHPHEQQIACVGLVMGGVLERHPRLRVAFLESGCGWLPHWLERMDDHVQGWGHCLAPLPLRPSEYFGRQCFVSTDPGERSLASVVALVGAEPILFATDYPHPDALSGDVVGRVAGRSDLGDAAKAQILRRNAERCFGLPARSSS
jgi:predicted TIM-barrel fold metal-dependent hydrolase